jgi:mono/diheme cytochrome c family protein
MDQLLEKVAEAKGMPASLAKRSAEARAKKTGEPLEAVLQEWAGIEPGTVVAPASPPEPAPPAPAQPETTAVPAEKTDADDVEIIDAEPVDTSDVAETDDEPAPKRGGYPIWLAAAFIVIPLLAVAYILVSPNGPDCGSGGLLGVDAVTGEAVNCDGSEYGVVTVDSFAAGGALYQQCVACHSDDGSGGVGPAFTAGAILVTFPEGSCSDHIAWVSAGTTGWPESTYGATDKPVGGAGVMPGFGASLTEEQIAQVALYERVAFGGEDLAEAEIDCGLVDAEDTAVEAADS